MVIIKKEKFTSEKSVLYKKDIQVSNNDEKTDTEIKENEKRKVQLGVAVDIGTTSIAVGVFDIEKGVLIGNDTQINCQTAYGSDVMMRIMHCVSGKEQLLHDMLIEQLENIIVGILEKNFSFCKIKKMVVVGNTTMCHIFLKEDVTGLKGAPFNMAYEGICKRKSADIGFKKCEIEQVIVLPSIKAHVGADAAAVLCKEKMYEVGKNEIAIDIGTNAEIILNRSGEVFVTSTAAGPAFEGKGIKSGMKAAAGAINSVKISRVNGNIILGMLDDGTLKEPTGICGSGLIDTVAELMKARLLTADGYLLTKKEALAQNVNINLCECLDDSDEKYGNSFVLWKPKGIAVTQKDIRNVQLAKGAIQAGTEILLEKAGLTMKDISRIKIAGVFGKYINSSSAMLFGLFPKYLEKLEFVGNAAGDGAALALFDDEFVADIEKQVKKVKHIELADEKTFQQKFLNAMELKEWYYS